MADKLCLPLMYATPNRVVCMSHVVMIDNSGFVTSRRPSLFYIKVTSASHHASDKILGVKSFSNFLGYI